MNFRETTYAGAIFSLPSSSTRVLCQDSHCSFLSTEEGDGWMDGRGRLFAVQLSGASVWSAHRPGNSRVAHHWGRLVAAASHYRSSITHVVRPVMNRGCLPRGESLVKQKKINDEILQCRENRDRLPPSQRAQAQPSSFLGGALSPHQHQRFGWDISAFAPYFPTKVSSFHVPFHRM